MRSSACTSPRRKQGRDPNLASAQTHGDCIAAIPSIGADLVCWSTIAPFGSPTMSNKQYKTAGDEVWRNRTDKVVSGTACPELDVAQQAKLMHA